MTIDHATRLTELAARYWNYEKRATPLLAALAGEPLDDAVLFRESIADHAARNAAAAEFNADLATIDRERLDVEGRATYDLLVRELDGIRAHHAVDAHLRPLLFPAGPDFTAVFWANGVAIHDATTAGRYVDQLAELPAYLRDVQDCIERGFDRGYRYPSRVLEAASTNTRSILANDVEASVWMGPFRRSSARGQAAVDAAMTRALEFARTTLHDAVARYADFLASLIARGPRPALSQRDEPLGLEHYAVVAKHFTTTTMTPEAIHALGLAEVERIEREIARVAADAGFANDVAAYRRFLSTDPQFIAPSVEALRTQVESLCKRIDRQIPTYFGRIPRITYGVDSMPQATSTAMPPAYAQPGPADGSAPGVFWVSGLPSKCPSYLHVALAVHEAWPGHLMHIALIQEATHLPAFRRFGSVKYTAFIEGWALYCESLGVEMGLYRTPHDHYGRLEFEMWRAVRLVVDTGIHWRGWTFDDAVAYMQRYLTLSKETIEGEVVRYAAMPGQALGYQIGNLKMRELRHRAEARLGTRFALRDFHDAITSSGAVSLPVLEGIVDAWIADREARRDAA